MNIKFTLKEDFEDIQDNQPDIVVDSNIQVPETEDADKPTTIVNLSQLLTDELTSYSNLVSLVDNARTDKVFDDEVLAVLSSICADKAYIIGKLQQALRENATDHSEAIERGEEEVENTSVPVPAEEPTEEEK